MDVSLFRLVACWTGALGLTNQADGSKRWIHVAEQSVLYMIQQGTCASVRLGGHSCFNIGINAVDREDSIISIIHTLYDLL